jgi:hypothetical protein
LTETPLSSDISLITLEIIIVVLLIRLLMLPILVLRWIHILNLCLKMNLIILDYLFLLSKI